LAEARRRLQATTSRIMRRDVRLRLARAWQRIDACDARMGELMRARMARARGRVDLANAHLTQLSPLKILDRGYAIVQTGAGLILKDPADSPPGTALLIRLARGLFRGQAT
jgi:exodeoxyribonuclease VII large subunit